MIIRQLTLGDNGKCHIHQIETSQGEEIKSEFGNHQKQESEPGGHKLGFPGSCIQEDSAGPRMHGYWQKQIFKEGNDTPRM